MTLRSVSAHYAVRFIPRENGVHYVHVQLDGAHIRGSPFRVVVGDVVPDPGLVTASGQGLTKAETGIEILFHRVASSEPIVIRLLLSLVLTLTLMLFPIINSILSGKVNKFTVHTVGAGASTLAVTIDGPSKVKLDAKEVPDGYEFSYTPSAPGNYYITVKYGGNNHIAGSPFKVKCTGKC